MQNARREGGYKPVELINDTFQIVQNAHHDGFLRRAAVALQSVAGGDSACDEHSGVHRRDALLRTRLSAADPARAGERGRSTICRRLLTEDSAAKEIKLFNLGDTLLEPLHDAVREVFSRGQVARVRRRAASVSALGLIATMGFYGSYAWIVWRTVQGQISLGDMTLYLTIFRQGQTTFQSILAAVGSIYENNLFMANLFEFLGIEPQMRVAAPATKVCRRRCARASSFATSAFAIRITNSGRCATSISLSVPAKRSRWSGHNGAGKTTLIKLLSRLYDPTEGSILIDGIDLRDIDPLELAPKDRRDLSGLRALSFAGAAKTSASARSKRWRIMDRIIESARKSGADAMIEGLAGRL